jgi:hypothetical protein
VINMASNEGETDGCSLKKTMSLSLFVPEIEQRRKTAHYSGPAVLILNGCSAHDGDFFLDLCMEHNVVRFPIPPEPSNQVQPLDLYVFEVTKRLMTRLNRMVRPTFALFTLRDYSRLFIRHAVLST